MAMGNADKIKAEIGASLGNFVNVILEVLLPVALFFIGLALLAPAIGLSGFYSDLLQGAGVGATIWGTASAGAAILTYLALGGGFVAVERAYDGWMGDIVGAIGWMSIGMALREILAFVTGQSPLPANALLNSAATRLKTGLVNASSAT
ncbi:MAG: hypothetical protein L3K19_09485 [Thermoplasmata archaeon]|nr:hypothetical protein [Thermoplasmata archaeon]